MNFLKKYISTKKQDNYLYLKIHVQQFNLFEKNIIASRVERAVEKNNYPDVIFDLSELVHLDSIGIGFLISTKNIFTENNREMLLVITSKKILEMFNSLKVKKFFKVFGSIEEAEAWLASSKEENQPVK